MSMVIRNNLNALNSHNNLARNVLGTRRASERLASGFRVNRAADDAAGLAVSESMRSQLRGLGQAIRNANDGISLIQTAEGALEETHAMLHRLQELATQSANDTYNNTDRAQIQREVVELLNEISRIATETDFNGVRLFNGTRGHNFAADAGRFTVDVGGNNAASVMSSLGLAVDGNGNTLVWNYGSATSSGNVVFAAGSHLGSASLTAAGMHFLSYQPIGYSSAGAGMATRPDSWFDAAHASAVGGITLQIGTNAATSQRLVLSFGNMTTTGLGLASLNLSTLAGAQIALGLQSANVTGWDADSVTSVGNIDDAMVGATANGGVNDSNNPTLSDSSSQRFVGPFPPGSIRFAINLVSSQRAQLGAWQNRLESTVANLTVNHENLTAAESQIRDADMAAEMIQFTKFNILQQSAQAMLAQANQAPQAVLQLLR
jgi:flagellin